MIAAKFPDQVRMRDARKFYGFKKSGVAGIIAVIINNAFIVVIAIQFVFESYPERVGPVI
ncbi:MAG: hypothetical protein BWY89_01562 [Bacteroidetes bacterium ADurb.BinA012]|nr:MAG: hypothetical protein BWY89_01562 [Bacteroidetes bacterium ADurb.BinA012]